ncbi:Panacea domain-containing protein [Endozoicomonas gorgoniicola]|uniref:Panacea domain-containing protein n=1 Tax=Endozoicomonas gorgoniicola TaxID=1234144 RepID=A0ABT3MNX6_9GAMM|nr:Panacea domain-containing protein [Endozoicomonas gorgoniicola]MCW7551077.1 Panacea domain-containing protein [Endozoicomonas gorgoniicola]MCW7556471.1 Panacea domain-containing protein [Endozoicomonas gorgoniicola]
MFNDRLAAQMAAYFLLRNRGRMSVLKLMKLLYLADRESMERYGYPISYDLMVSLDHGPVLSRTLNHINDSAPSSVDGWKDWIGDRAGYEVDLRKDKITLTDLDELSKADVSVLQAVWDKFGHMHKYDLSDYTHDECPEWQDPKGSSLPLRYKDVFQALGKSPEEAEELQAEIYSKQSVDDIFASL